MAFGVKEAGLDFSPRTPGLTSPCTFAGQRQGPFELPAVREGLTSPVVDATGQRRIVSGLEVVAHSARSGWAHEPCC